MKPCSPRARPVGANTPAAGTIDGASLEPASGGAATEPVRPSVERFPGMPPRPGTTPTSSRGSVQGCIKGLETAIGRWEKALRQQQPDTTRALASNLEIATRRTVIADLLEFSRNGRLGRVLPQAAASLTHALRHAFPPERYTYVMVGNSPAPLMAFLQQTDARALVVHLPVGGIPAPAFDAAGPDALALVRQTVEECLDDVLRAPAAVGRPPVLIDFVSTGKTIRLLEKFLGDWSETHAGNRRVAVFAYGSELSPDLKQWWGEGEAGMRVFHTPSDECERAFMLMSSSKIFKKVMELKAPRSITFGSGSPPDVTTPAKAVEQHQEQWENLQTLLVVWRAANPAPAVQDEHQE